MMEIGSGTSIHLMGGFRRKLEIRIHMSPFESATTREKKQIIAKIVDMPPVMLDLSLLKKHLRNIWDSALKNALKMPEMMDS